VRPPPKWNASAITSGRILPAAREPGSGRAAAALAVSRQTVISIENGRYMPSLPLAFRIARFFDVPVDKMFTPEDKDLGA
jgi:putative transcriptional regulator